MTGRFVYARIVPGRKVRKTFRLQPETMHHDDEYKSKELWERSRVSVSNMSKELILIKKVETTLEMSGDVNRKGKKV